jgi:tRNA pseudouridine13 synthase
MNDLPRLLADFEPAPGIIKADYEDFVVEEVPLYPADGTGTHTYFLLEKAGLSTQQAVHDLARALGVRRFDIGFAGQKDSRAVTRQWMSLEHVPPERIAAVDLPRLRVLETTLHRNKLKLGHLKGNHFQIKVRSTAPERLAELQEALEALSRKGVPNYFGPQRFGYRGDTWQTGRAILRRDLDEVLGLILGRPTDADYGNIRKARRHFDAGRYREAARAWPYSFHTERRMLKALLRSEGKLHKAYGAIDKRTRDFFISAYQSALFNLAVAERMSTGLATLMTGDLAWRHDSGAVFHVEDADQEQPRADAFEISPTGPLFGERMTEPSRRPREIEQGVLEAEQLSEDTFGPGGVRVRGGRRAVRFRPGNAQLALGADGRGEYLALEFVLPSGCYATALLRELFSLQQPARDDAAEGEGMEE